MAKKKHHKNNQGVAYVEVEKGFWYVGKIICNMAPNTILSTTAHSSPVRPDGGTTIFQKTIRRH